METDRRRKIEEEKSQSCHEFKWLVIALELLLIIMNKLRGTEIYRLNQILSFLLFLQPSPRAIRL